MFLTKSDVQLLDSEAMYAYEGARDEEYHARLDGTPEHYWLPDYEELTNRAKQLWWLVEALGDKRPACPEAMTGFSCAKQFVAWETTDVHDNYEF